MATFKRSLFKSTTNYVKANFICGHNPIRKVSELIDSDGNLSFNDETSNFSELKIDKSIDYFANQTGDLELDKCNITAQMSNWQCATINGGKITPTTTHIIAKFPNVTYIHLNSIGNNMWQQIRTCPELTTVIIDDCSALKYNNDYGQLWGIFADCNKLSRLVMNGLTWGGLDLIGKPFTRESLVEFFESLGQADLSARTNQTITLGSILLPLLTDEDKKIATDKGWTLA